MKCSIKQQLLRQIFKLYYKKIFLSIGFSAIALLSCALPALSDTTTSEKSKTCLSTLGEDLKKQKPPQDLQSRRVELYYYRNAKNIVELLHSLSSSIGYPGCPDFLPTNDFSITPGTTTEAGKGVGRGGGNIIMLYGSGDYIKAAQRLIVVLDLPLPGINLQLWGVQISSGNPARLAETMYQVRRQISVTQQLLRDTFSAIHGISQEALQSEQHIDVGFRAIATQLGYAEAIDGFGSESLLEVTLAGDAIKKEKRIDFYQRLYDEAIVRGKIENGRFIATNPELQPYFDAYKNEINRPPFERFFRSRGLIPKPVNCNLQEGEKCEQWVWKDNVVENLKGEDVSLVEITANFERKLILEFAHQYTHFLFEPNKFDPNELQRTAEALNTLLQRKSNLLQKDIEDFFVRPTLAMIQDVVRDDKKVSFAQVGRSTISTLNGVPTSINTRSYSTDFQVPQNDSFSDLLRALETSLSLEDGTADVTSIGSLGVPQLIEVIAALNDETTTPVSIQTGTNLTFTPGISRNLSAAEININLSITDPNVTPTDAKPEPFSRIGQQTVTTTVYAQALDFFDLSTFTSEASVDGGRYVIPIIGQVWNAIFDPIPILGDLFSFDRGNQNVLHENLLLTTSFITPTSLSLGTLYPPTLPFTEDFCKRRDALHIYLKNLGLAGNASPRETPSVGERCPQPES